ncbi:MAG: hypothetical protein Phog2KO_31380 [Phototrophicaceae bacterium]
MSNKHRLLLIEDDIDVAEMLLIYFQSQKYEVMHADNGADGIELARTKFPNLILLDVMLPDMDGYEICYQLRKMALTKYIPTLFLTQKDGRASKVKGLELGADDYITKPFDIDELRLRVENSIRRATRENLTEARTGLPTGELVQEERDKRSDTTEIIFTLEGFDVYTDVYSFIAANNALYHAGKTIRDVLSELGQHNDFVGIENDKFIVLTDYVDTEAIKEKIKQDFKEKVHTFYSFKDAERGGLELSDSNFVPMMSLTTDNAEPLNDEANDTPSDSVFDW